MASDLLETWAIVVAAGEGRRLGADRPKAFVGFGGRVLLAHSVELLERHPAVDAIVLVVPAGWEEPATLVAEELAAGKVRAAVAGGPSRSQSVQAGLQEVDPQAAVIVVHDAARPLADDELLTRVLEGLAGGADGVVPALPVSDTIKRVRNGTVAETLDRSELRAVQTPQAFLAAALRAAYERQAEDLAAATDCAGLVESAGMTVTVVDGSPGNVKLTGPADLRLAEALL